MTSRMTSPHLWRSAGAVSLAAVMLIAGGAQAIADPVQQTRFKIDWWACESSPQTQCGTLRVPIDWSKPSGPTISLSVAQRPAKDPTKRVGALFFNPGGPGDGAAKYIAEAEKLFSPTLMAAEDSFNRFADWCPTADTCALRGQDVRAVFDRLVVQTDQNPIPAEGALRAVTGEDIRMGTKGLLRFKEPSIFGPDPSWAGLSRALKKAIDGDGSAFAVAPAGVPQYSIQGLLANACLDYVPQVRTYREMQQRLELADHSTKGLSGVDL